MISEYEELRISNIQRNNAILEALQIPSEVETTPLRSGSERPSERPKSSKQDFEPRRTSARNLRTKELLIEKKLLDKETELVVTSDAKRQKLTEKIEVQFEKIESKVSRKRSPPTQLFADKNSSRNIVAEVESLKSIVGDFVPGGTVKAGVMRYVSPKLEPKFNKYSGVLEWQNAIFLMLNVAGNHYDNTFELEGREFAVNYFLSERTSPEAPVLARIASSASDGVSLHLFCRAADLSQGPPIYVYFGRLAYRQHWPQIRPIRVRLAMQDHDLVRTAPAARRLLDLAGAKD